ELLLRPAHGFYRAIVQLIARCREPNKGAAVLVSHRLAALPGFMTELARLEDAHVEALPPAHAALAVLASRRLTEAPPASGVKLLKHLPWRAPAVDVAAAAPAAAAASAHAAAPAGELMPTHVV